MRATPSGQPVIVVAKCFSLACEARGILCGNKPMEEEIEGVYIHAEILSRPFARQYFHIFDLQVRSNGLLAHRICRIGLRHVRFDFGCNWQFNAFAVSVLLQ